MDPRVLIRSVRLAVEALTVSGDGVGMPPFLIMAKFKRSATSVVKEHRWSISSAPRWLALHTKPHTQHPEVACPCRGGCPHAALVEDVHEVRLDRGFGQM